MKADPNETRSLRYEVYTSCPFFGGIGKPSRKNRIQFWVEVN